MSFGAYHLGVVQIVIPIFSAGVLLFGFFLFVYLSGRYRNGLYLSTAVIALVALAFSAAEIALIVFGVLPQNIPLGFQLNLLQQLIPNNFLWATPLFLHFLVGVNTRWKRINLGFIVIMAALSLTITGIGFLKPEWFISVTEPLAFHSVNAADVMRGRSGWAFDFRNLLLSVCVLYFLAVLFVEMILRRKTGYLLFPAVGAVLAILAGLDDLFFLYTGRNMVLQVPLSRFPVGISCMIVLCMSSVFVHFLNTERALLEARRILRVSEQKNSILVEGTEECVFALDPDLTFISVNRKAQETFGLNGKHPGQRRFVDLVHEDSQSRDLSRHLISEKIAALKVDRKPVSFQIPLVSPLTQEPEDYQFRIEYFEMDGHVEYLGRAWSVIRSSLARCVEKESLTLSIENYLSAVNEVCNRLTENLRNYIAVTEIQLIKMGLRELIVNAVEHGNLNITFEEKTEALSAGRYFDLIAARQQLPEYRDRRVRIEYELSDKAVSYSIRDGGSGFDHTLFTGSSGESRSLLSHGRGILMARNIFDALEYHGSGNRVTAVKGFPGQAS